MSILICNMFVKLPIPAVSGRTDEKSRQLALYYGLPGVIATQSEGTWPDEGTNYGNSAENGIPAIVLRLD